MLNRYEKITYGLRLSSCIPNFGIYCKERFFFNCTWQCLKNSFLHTASYHYGNLKHIFTKLYKIYKKSNAWKMLILWTYKLTKPWRWMIKYCLYEFQKKSSCNNCSIYRCLFTVVVFCEVHDSPFLVGFVDGLLVDGFDFGGWNEDH